MKRRPTYPHNRHQLPPRWYSRTSYWIRRTRWLWLWVPLYLYFSIFDGFLVVVGYFMEP